MPLNSPDHCKVDHTCCLVRETLVNSPKWTVAKVPICGTSGSGPNHRSAKQLWSCSSSAHHSQLWTGASQGGGKVKAILLHPLTWHVAPSGTKGTSRQRYPQRICILSLHHKKRQWHFFSTETIYKLWTLASKAVLLLKNPILYETLYELT